MGHNRLIITKTKDIEEALFYCQESYNNSWNRDTLEAQIDSNLRNRLGSKSNNFDDTLSRLQSKNAQQVLKDPYNFDFLGLEEDALERELENEITKNITDFFLELGKGFAFLGRQFKIEVSDNDYFIDLLFCHLDLRCYAVVELKAGRFKPEYAGKLNFYLSAVDTQLKKDSDNQTIFFITPEIMKVSKMKNNVKTGLLSAAFSLMSIISSGQQQETNHLTKKDKTMETKTKEISAKFPYESKYIEVKGSKMHYIDEGKGDKTVGRHYYQNLFQCCSGKLLPYWPRQHGLA